MKFRSAALIVVVLLFGWVALDSPARADELTDSRTALREAIRAEDMDAVVAVIERARKAGPEELRSLYEVFDTTDPATAAFVSRWWRTMTGTTYGRVAEARILYKRGWLSRGTKSAAMTHPQALEDFRFNHFDAWHLADNAYHEDPDLLPASDMLILLGNSVNEREYALAVLDDVMKRQPNWGTLERALLLTHSGWGGSDQMVEELCRTYAPMIPANGRDLVQRCRLVGLSTYHIVEHRDELSAMLDAMTEEVLKDDPQLAYLKARRMIYTDKPDKAGAEHGKWVLDTFPVTDVHLAWTYDAYFAMPMGLPQVGFKVRSRAVAEARAALEYDPYDHALLELLSEGIPLAENRMGAIDPDEALDFAWRRLKAEPYSGDAWKSFQLRYSVARKVYQTYSDSFLTDEGIWTNVIHYSFHDADVIASYMASRYLVLEELRRARAEQGKPDSWRKPRPEIDENARLICPLLRAWRVLEAVNAMHERKADYPLDAQQVDAYLALRDAAQQAGACVHEREAPLETLAYQPVEPRQALESY